MNSHRALLRGLACAAQLARRRSRAAAAFHMQREQLLLTDLPADVVQHIVVRLTLAHDIARTAPTC